MVVSGRASDLSAGAATRGRASDTRRLVAMGVSPLLGTGLDGVGHDQGTGQQARQRHGLGIG
jgi:hypothetical protein